MADSKERVPSLPPAESVLVSVNLIPFLDLLKLCRRFGVDASMRSYC